jgi:proteasome accessory factor C
MTEHKRLFNLLQMIALLSRPGGFSVKRLASRFQVSTRTIYRYFDILRECGFQIEKSGNRRRFKQPSDSLNLLPQFTAIEAELIRKAILALSPEDSRRNGLLNKLNVITDPAHIADMIVDAKTAGNVSALLTAVRKQKRVVLHHYHSPNSETTQNRTVDPLGFSTNMKYLLAFDPDHQKVIQFKPERIEIVEVTGTMFEPDKRYQVEKPDLFGMNGTPHREVILRLNSRALRLLLEEFPESRNLPGLADAENLKNPENKNHTITLPVKGYDGVGRFVLGLPGEAVPLGPAGFLRYLKKRMEKGALQKTFLKQVKS